MTREEALASVLYAACGADLDGHESYLKMARAVLAHLGEGREQEEIRGLTSERDQFEAERACSIHEGWKLVWCNECVRVQAAAHAEQLDKANAQADLWAKAHGTEQGKRIVLEQEAAAHSASVLEIQVTLLEVRETLLRWYRLDSKPSVNELGRLIDRVSEVASPPETP